MSWVADHELSILVVDNEQEICNAIQRLFAQHYTVVTSTSVQVAHEYLMNNEFGLVIIDYDLNGDMDGIRFAEYVKVLSPLSYTIMLTGHNDFNLVKRALNEGNIDKFLIKPFVTDELMTLVEDSLAHYSSKREIFTMLESQQDSEMAQDLLAQVLNESSSSGKGKMELRAVIISRNSIPVYSKFINKEDLKSFTDTIFSGFMTAIHMVGQEIFTEDSSVDLIKFDNYSIFFHFYQRYQFSFIMSNTRSSSKEVFEDLRPFILQIIARLDQDPKFFNAKSNYFKEVDALLESLLQE